jgi:hypothetical protein
MKCGARNFLIIEKTTRVGRERVNWDVMNSLINQESLH